MAYTTNRPLIAAPIEGQDAAASRPYRVLMIAPTSFFADYGCHVRILEEALTLQKLGHHITIVTYANGRSLPGLDIHRTLPIPWRRDYEVGSSRHKIAFDALLGATTLSILARGQYDIIHAHLHEGALIGLVLGRLFGLPVVFDFQGSLTEEMIDHHFLRRGSALYRPLRRVERWVDCTSPIVFTSSAHAEHILIDQFQVKPEHIRALPDSVNTDVFVPASRYDPAELARLRAGLNLPPTGKVVVYLGLLAEYQGTGHLLDAFQRIVRQHANVYLLLMGFPGQHIYQQRAEALGIAHAVRFTGRIPYEDAPRYLALGDVAAAPKLSLTESSGKLLNYMAVALPTVAFDTPVAREYLGSDGLFAGRGDVNSLADQLETALFPPAEAPRLYIEAGYRLRQRALQQFEWRQTALTIVESYAALTNHHEQSPASRSVLATRR